MKPVRAKDVIIRVSLFCFILPFLCSLIFASVLYTGKIPGAALLPLTPVLMMIIYFIAHKKLIPAVAWVNGWILVILVAVLSLTMFLSMGALNGMTSLTGLMSVPLYLGLLLMLQIDRYSMAYLMIIICAFTAFVSSVLLQEETRKRGAKILKFAAAFTLVTVLLGGLDIYMYQHRAMGVGFSPLHGWSDRDYEYYAVSSETSLLPAPGHTASFTIEDPDEMPVMGGESCYPMYAAVAKAVYKDIDIIEREYAAAAEAEPESRNHGRIVTVSDSAAAFSRLIGGDGSEGGRIDLYFGLRPSSEQLNEAKSNQADLRITPIGREAIVFFVDPDNPVTDLSSEEIRKIYRGDIKNWSELGGKKQKLIAYMGPENAASEAMLQIFMGEEDSEEAKDYEPVDSMEKLLNHVAQNSAVGDDGFSFGYLNAELTGADNVRLLSIDGVEPTPENIENGSYPLSVDLCLITRADSENPNVQKMIDFCLSEEGQELIGKSGYAGIAKKTNEQEKAR